MLDGEPDGLNSRAGRHVVLAGRRYNTRGDGGAVRPRRLPRPERMTGQGLIGAGYRICFSARKPSDGAVLIGREGCAVVR